MKRDFSYGIIPVTLMPGETSPRYLILLQKGGKWSFPKGHAEGTETPHESAFREFREETGIHDVQLLDTDPISIEFMIKHRTQKKSVTLFLGYVTDTDVRHQREEIQKPAWLTYPEALTAFGPSISSKALTRAHSAVIALQRAGKLVPVPAESELGVAAA